MDLSFLEKIAIKYLEDHPEVVEKLIAAIADRIIEAIQNHNKPAPSSPSIAA